MRNSLVTSLAFCILALPFVSRSPAGVVYHDPTDWRIGAYSANGLDINDDGVNDFFINSFLVDCLSGGYAGMRSVPGSGNGIVADPLNYQIAFGFLPGALLGASQPYEIRGDFYRCSATGCNGEWCGDGKSMGFRLMMNGQPHYGWLRVSNRSGVVNGGLWVECWAYESLPNTPIVVGDTGGACDGLDFNNDGLFPDTGDVESFLNAFSGVCAPRDSARCNSDLDFNNDGLFPDTLDIEAFLSVLSGGTCLR